MAKKAKATDANYNHPSTVREMGDKRTHVMGDGNFANLPREPIFKTFNQMSASYRDGIQNNPATGVEMISDVYENGCR